MYATFFTNSTELTTLDKETIVISVSIVAFEKGEEH